MWSVEALAGTGGATRSHQSAPSVDGDPGCAPVGDVRRFGGQLVTIPGCPGESGQRQGAHRADCDRGTKTANFVTERHLGFGCRRAISADMRAMPGQRLAGHSLGVTDIRTSDKRYLAGLAPGVNSRQASPGLPVPVCAMGVRVGFTGIQAGLCGSTGIRASHHSSRQIAFLHVKGHMAPAGGPGG
jgi:hypothetical protein